DNEWRKHLAVVEFDKPKAWRLVVEGEEGGPPGEEFAFTVYGALARHDLLPISVGKRMR
ncbi:hypothetical protein H0H93_015867, partial [Arthromyces matolae]